MYGTLTEANTYHANDLTGTWSAYTDAQKNKALETATNQIDRLPFAGEKYLRAPTQTLQFPRVHYASGRTLWYEQDLSSGEIVVPPDVEAATYIQAKFLLDLHVGHSEERAAAYLNGVTSVSQGSTSESFDFSHAPVDVKSGLCREAYTLVEKYMLRSW